MLAFIAVKILGKRMGSAKMAVMVELLLVLEAIAAVRVRVEEMEHTPSKTAKKNSELFSIGLPNRTMKSRKFKPRIMRFRKALKISFEKIMEDGRHS